MFRDYKIFTTNKTIERKFTEGVIVIVASGKRKEYMTAQGNKVWVGSTYTGLTTYFKIFEEIGLTLNNS